MRAVVCLGVALAGSAPTGSASASAPPQPVLTVREPVGAAMQAWPVWAGVPLPAGRVRDPGGVRLYEQGGEPARPVPVQSRVLGRWPDGSVRWVGLDWQTDLAPRQERRFVVQMDGPLPERRDGASPPRLQVRDTPLQIEVDTGAVQFSVPRRSAGFLTDLRRPGRTRVAPRVSGFMDVGGARHGALTPESVDVTELGPLRVRIAIRGRYTAAFRYGVRVDAYAGQPFVRILHTFEQQGPERYTPLGQLALEISAPGASDAFSYRAGREGGDPWTGPVTERGIAIVQEDNESVRVGGTRYSGHAAGWIDVGDGNGGVALVARYFWQEYPQSLVVREETLTYNLWAPDVSAAMIGMGTAKTHELVLMPHAAVPEPATLEALRAPLTAAVSPDWVATSGALRNAVAPAAAGDLTQRFATAAARAAAHAETERWDDGNSVICADPARERPRRGFYGMLNWGDWNFPGYHDSVKGCDAWGNLEYDTAQVYALAYAATGELRYHDALVAAARHFMDVDRIHYQNEHPSWVGMNHPKNPLHFSFELGGVDLGHTWNEGLLSYYFVTGDDRGLTAARGIADYLATRIGRGNVRGNPRQWGWPQVALVAAYDATGHPAYRDAALAYARGGMAAHAPQPINEWKLGILADGLSYTHALTGDADVLGWLERYAAAWGAQPELSDPRLLPGVAYVARLHGDETLRRRVLDRVARMQFGSWAKPLTIGGRTAFRVVSLLGGLPAVAQTVGSDAAAATGSGTSEVTAQPTPWLMPGADWVPTPVPWQPTPPAHWPSAEATATPPGAAQ